MKIVNLSTACLVALGCGCVTEESMRDSEQGEIESSSSALTSSDDASVAASCTPDPSSITFFDLSLNRDVILASCATDCLNHTIETYCEVQESSDDRTWGRIGANHGQAAHHLTVQVSPKVLVHSHYYRVVQKTHFFGKAWGPWITAIGSHFRWP
jgi:hypothetical protein